ncbi:phosphate/phosphite/phosphonate ABC transporter substrate-binding protein [Noviherbaspirillum sedimenti]|uniref:Phosphate/phosphite/phosphonate ABC transporter substrate-binding protein n=1 Tax=Noviherbaspirillum sedimenti TaxID=2320865 RepID=A0A3A3G2K7_9BURK|nr:phosphate/phosphite/phosphonate ABC transporter substrate-binding protein [Noviherbaspirillum sedimenti]RJG01059.1 phosphate/phosphite/phosphonate ABC transporter substrate-binding protein [Noviherbaspirillum sedimenti]
MIRFKTSPALGFRHGLLRLSIAAVLMLLAAHALAIECEKPHHLRFAMVPQDDLQKDIAAHQPLFDSLQAATGLPVEVVMPSSYGAVVEGLLAGAIDLANLGPAAYLNAKKADPRITAFAATAKKKGAFQEEGAFYTSLLIVRRQGPYTALETLRGKKLALVDPDSTSGALIPRQEFSRHVQVPLGGYFSQVGYTGSHDQSALAVVNGRVDAAFVSSYLLTSLVEAGKASAGDFRVLWRSARMPVNPYVYRGQLCASLKDKISAVFLGQNGAGNKALLDNLKALRFVPISDGDYQILRDLP